MIEKNKFGIKDLAKEDRPREKLLEKGLFSLTDAELIAILIGSGSRKESAVELAQKILREYKNNLNELGRATVEQLKINFHGVGDAKAVTIVAAMELGRRRLSQEVIDNPSIKSSHDIFKIFKPVLNDLNHEEFWIIFLNRSNKVITRFLLSKGGIGETVTDVRLIFKKALENLATSIILCHNHPSGNLTPSREDFAVTKKIEEAGKLLDIKVLDHIIIANNNFYSFADNNFIENKLQKY